MKAKGAPGIGVCFGRLKSNSSILSDGPGDHPALCKNGCAFSSEISIPSVPEITLPPSTLSIAPTLDTHQNLNTANSLYRDDDYDGQMLSAYDEFVNATALAASIRYHKSRLPRTRP